MMTNQTEAERRQQSEIDKGRQGLGKTPDWLKNRIAAWKQENGFAHETDEDVLQDHFPGRAILDHWGTMEDGSHDAFVTEPYQFRVSDVQKFIAELGPYIQWRFCPVSWHDPGEAVRLLFWEKPEYQRYEELPQREFTNRTPHPGGFGSLGGGSVSVAGG